jgi:glycine/D-amino acid oxidase-like deaminating enzyme
MRVIVIGAGIIGAALADRLAASAIGVTIVEAAEPGQGTSRTSLGWVNANGTLDEGYFAFRVAAMRAWAELAVEFGAPAWYVPSGNLTWADTDQTRQELAARLDRLRGRGYRARLLSPARISAIEPALRDLPRDALAAHFPDEGFVHGAPAAQALTGRALAAGARLITGDAVAGLDTRGDRITGVRLASGDHLTADVVICSAGWRTPGILATADASVPLLDVHAPGSAAPGLTATTTSPGPLRGMVQPPRMYLRPAWNNGLFLEATDVDARTDMTTSHATLTAHAEELLARAGQTVTGLARTRIADARRCVRPMPLDGFPLIGWCRPGLYVAVTHSGITLAAHLGRLIAHEIRGDAPAAELSAYRADRTTARS